MYLRVQNAQGTRWHNSQIRVSVEERRNIPDQIRGERAHYSGGLASVLGPGVRRGGFYARYSYLRWLFTRTVECASTEPRENHVQRCRHSKNERRKRNHNLR